MAQAQQTAIAPGVLLQVLSWNHGLPGTDTFSGLALLQLPWKKGSGSIGCFEKFYRVFCVLKISRQ
jgi:hypothetical protein